MDQTLQLMYIKEKNRTHPSLRLIVSSDAAGYLVKSIELDYPCRKPNYKYSTSEHSR